MNAKIILAAAAMVALAGCAGSGLSEAEKVDYELVIEEEAYPFEERAIDVHEENFELLAGGIYNPWVQKSLNKLAVLMPGRYAKNEISGGFLGSIDMYAYRMPIAPGIGIDGETEVADPESGDTAQSPAATALAPDAAVIGGNEGSGE